MEQGLTFKVAAKLRASRTETDAQVAVALEQCEAKVACERGCHQCCKFVVTCFVVEAVAIVRSLEEQGKAAWLERSILPICEAQEKELLKHGTTNRSWFVRQITCPLLGVYFDCTVYEDRPDACRGYFACKPQAPSVCSDPDAMVPTPNLGDYTTATIRRCDRISQRFGLPSAMVPLPAALRWAHAFVSGGREAWAKLARDTYGTANPLTITERWCGLELEGGIR